MTASAEISVPVKSNFPSHNFKSADGLKNAFTGDSPSEMIFNSSLEAICKSNGYIGYCCGTGGFFLHRAAKNADGV